MDSGPRQVSGQWLDDETSIFCLIVQDKIGYSDVRVRPAHREATLSVVAVASTNVVSVAWLLIALPICNLESLPLEHLTNRGVQSSTQQKVHSFLGQNTCASRKRRVR